MKRLVLFLLICTLSISVLGCAGKAKDGVSQTEETNAANRNESETDNSELVIDAGVPDEELSLMQKVLFNKAEYNDGKMIDDIQAIYRDEYDRPVNFYVVDLDADDVDEVCLEYAGGDILILHETDGKVYGYDWTFRQFNPVYKDGTFEGSGGASVSSFYGNVKFATNSFQYDVITSQMWEDNGETVRYYKDGEPTESGRVEITEEEYNEIMSAYAMEEIEKHELNVDNVLKYVETKDEVVVRDLSAWFAEYNGEGIQRIPSNDPLDINASVRTRGDVIYYKTDETDMQVVVKTMLDAMIKPLMEEEEGRTYKIIRYELEEQPIEQIEENVWLLKIVKGYYEYEGRDFITMEDALTYENNTKDGMVKFFAQGSEDAFQYLILKEGNVYRLEFEDNMDFEINR